MRVVLVSCVAKKADYPAPAAELYQSAWFKKARAYAKQFGAGWYILSARHNLVSPTTVLAPYNQTLNGLSADSRREWAVETFRQIREQIPVCELIILAGTKYREYLVPALEAAGYEVIVPMAHLGIGQQMQWLDKELAGA